MVTPESEKDCQPPAVPGYQLQELLGRGGSGEVWRAVPRGGGPPVAVKVLVSGDPERQAREAALLGELDHPHLVRLHEVVHQPRRGDVPRVALVLDLLAGGSLAALLVRRGRLRPGEVVTAIAPVAAALAAAHDRGVVHGDLSPGNIVFTAEGRPVLTDLGVARVLGEGAAGGVTPAYVDPTVARGGATGPASDVFGVAAAAFHALTGVPPWNAAGPEETLRVAAAGALPDLAELAPEAPADLLRVLARGLAADPHERGSAAAFALDLRHACRPEPVRLPVAGIPDAELGRTGRGPRTELTHEVPGRRPRPPVVVQEAHPRRGIRRLLPVVGLPRRRPLTDRGIANPEPPKRTPGAHAAHRPPRRVPPGPVGVLAGLLVAAVATALIAGPRTGGPSDAGAGRAAPSAAAATTRAAPAPAAASEGERAESPGASPPAGRTPGDRTAAPAVPATGEEWKQVLADLYARRAEAFARGSAAALAEVYSEGSELRAADERFVADLRTADQVLRGFAPSVVRVTVRGTDGEGTWLHVVDTWPEYDVVRVSAPDGPTLRTGPARPESAVLLLLVRAPDGWRIERAREPR